MSKVVIGMSGGVDSSAAAVLLTEAGYEVIGVTLKLWRGETSDGGCCSLSAVNDARRVADMLGIPFYVINFTDLFDKYVINDFVTEYAHGRTPNPCIMCNRHLKFDALLNKAREIGADYIATGHYAKIEKTQDRYFLKRSADAKKDQTYFLYTLTQEQLSHTLFPLYGITKDETRAIAKKAGLPVAQKRDSQEICFVPDGKYSDFIRERTKCPPCGDFITADGKTLGTHSGIINYTVGQRKGLGIALNKPVYVTKIDADSNTVTLGDNADLYGTELYATNTCFIPFDSIPDSLRCTAKIRYSTTDAPCTVIPYNDGVKVIFDSPQRAITPGQAVVFYDNETVIGGGIINA